MWSLGTKLAFAVATKESMEPVDKFGPSQNIPDNSF
jgi:hypothetical protein